MSGQLPNRDPVISLCEKWWQAKRELITWTDDVFSPADNAAMDDESSEENRQAAKAALKPLNNEQGERLHAWNTVLDRCAEMPATTMRGVMGKLRIVVAEINAGAWDTERDGPLLQGALMDMERLVDAPASLAPRTKSKRPYDADDDEERQWREMSFATKGRHWIKVATTANTDQPDNTVASSAQWQIGAARAAEMISHLRRYPFGAGAQGRLTDIIQDMTDTKLGHVEQGFINRLAEFLGRNAFTLKGDFEAVPNEYIDFPRDRDIDAEGDAQ